MHVPALPLLSMLVTESHYIRWVFQHKVQKLTPHHLSFSGYNAITVSLGAPRNYGWGRAAKNKSQVMPQSQPGSCHCGGHRASML